ncbi:hypothetical protein ACFW2X_04860 [Streptomyces antibioticus]|uniref:hypothetical protein n=1 Tax=Streptomyces antibioticus TaxID=1890 RepID=UPI0036C406C1
MLDHLWESAAGKITEKIAASAVPALVFWLGGALAWAYSRGGFTSLKEPAKWLGKQPGAIQAILAVAVLVGLTATGILVRRLTLSALPLLEGYWPRCLKSLSGRLISRKQKKAQGEAERLQELAGPVFSGAASPEQIAEFHKLDRRRRRRPSDPRHLLPTRLGNILRSAESLPTDKYGLDLVVIWPRLWLLLPDATQRELTTARNAIDQTVSCCVWGLFFLLFSPWALWVIPIGLAIAVASTWWWLPNRAEIFADLLEATIDLHRTAIYRQLRWPLPTDPAAEQAQGQRLTTYLMRGSDDTNPHFAPDQDVPPP